MSVEAVRTFIGQEVYSVKIDDSQELQQLIAQAEQYKDAPFETKLAKVKEIATNAMQNAWEGMQTTSDPIERDRYSNLIFSEHPLSDALKAKAGCCRYQATLFLILGAAANLGDRHYLQNVPVGQGVNTCFNDVYDGQKVHHVSIFTESLKDKELNYSKDGTIYQRPNLYKRGQTFLSYSKQDDQIQYHFHRNHHAGQDPTVVQAVAQFIGGMNIGLYGGLDEVRAMVHKQPYTNDQKQQIIQILESRQK